jgi:hypothetical protein
VHLGAEPGHDTPDLLSGQTRPGKLALLLMLSLVVGIIVGGAIMLQIKGWTSVFTLAGGSCGSDKGVNDGPCPAGVNGILGVSAAIGLAALIGSLAILMKKKKWARSILLAVGVPVGLLAGQWLFGVIHGTGLPVAWAAPPSPPGPAAAR